MTTVLTTLLGGLLDDFAGRVSVFARNLDSGETLAIDPDTPKATASAAKQLVLLTFADGVSARAFDPAERVELTAADVVLGTGVLRYCAPGLRPTLLDLAYLMTIVSDNLATNLLLEAVGGPESVARVLAGLGISDAEVVQPISFSSTDVVFARATARALAESFAVLAEPDARAFDPDAAHLCLEILRRQQLLEQLPRFLPWNSHAVDIDVELPLTYYGKTGNFPGVCTEAALFVTKQDRYAVAVMIDELKDRRANSTGDGPTLLARIGEALYHAWGIVPPDPSIQLLQQP